MKQTVVAGFVIAFLVVIAMSRIPWTVYAIDNTSVENTSAGNTSVINIPVAQGGSTIGNSRAVDTTTVSGCLTVASITVSAPSAINFGSFKAGWNVGNSSTVGTVTVIPGTFGSTAWTVTAESRSPYLSLMPAHHNPGDSDGVPEANAGATPVNLTDYLLVGKDGTSGPWFCASGSTGKVEGTTYSGELTYTGTTASGSLPFYAEQYITSSDTVKGTYSDTIVFTGTCAP